MNKNLAGLGAQIRRAIPGGHTVTEAAALLDVSAETLTRWRKSGTYIPGESYQAGQIVVPVYTGSDIAALRLLGKRRPGRPAAGRGADRALSTTPTTRSFTSRLGPTYRTAQQLKRLQRIEQLLTERRADAAQEYLDRLINLTPTDRRFVQREIDAARG